jgi:hypothetical protein
MVLARVNRTSLAIFSHCVILPVHLGVEIGVLVELPTRGL